MLWTFIKNINAPGGNQQFDWLVYLFNQPTLHPYDHSLIPPFHHTTSRVNSITPKMQTSIVATLFTLAVAATAQFAGPCTNAACGESKQVCGQGLVCVGYPTLDAATRQGCTCSGKCRLYTSGRAFNADSSLQTEIWYKLVTLKHPRTINFTEY